MHKFLKLLFAFLIMLAVFAAMLFFARGLFPQKYTDEIEKYCDEFDVEKSLVLAVVKAESNFNPNAKSHAGANGLMQITDETFEFCCECLGIENASVSSPEDNIRAGVWYLSYLQEMYDGNIENVVAAYNAGSSNVDSWLADEKYSEDGKTLDEVPFGETRRHIKKIKAYKKIYELIY